PIASGGSESPGGPCTHWKAPPCHGAHPKLTSVRCSTSDSSATTIDRRTDIKRPYRRDRTQPRLLRQGFQASRLPANHHRDALDLRIRRVAVDENLGHDGVLAGRQPVV